MSTRTIAVAIAFTAAILTVPAHAQGQNPPGVNPTHYQCYEVTSVQSFQPIEVKLRDQFGRSQVMLQKPNYICAPVQKNSSRPSDRRTHLVCYLGFDAQPANKQVRVQNQFGRDTLGVGKPVFVCAPSLKRIVN
jgi:hypothetical protein